MPWAASGSTSSGSPTIDSPAWNTALTYYSDILKADGPPGASSNGFNENLALFASGHCGMWIDATVAGGMLFDTKQSQVADKVGFAPMPTGSFTGRPDLAVELEPGHPGLHQAGDAAKTFVTWATVQGLHQARRQGERLGVGAAGHAAVHL